MKRWIVSILIFAMLLSAASIPAYAAGGTVKYNTLDEIKEDLEIFKTIATGTISAVKSGSTWYYQFTRKGQTTVRIKASAFTTTPKNTNLAKDNQVLQNNLAKDSNHMWDRVCYYNSMTSKKYKDYTSYSTSLYRLILCVGGTSDVFWTKCTLTHSVNFTYNTKIEPRFDKKNTGSDRYNRYVTPSTAAQYIEALQRSSIVKQLIPTADVTVTNTGKNNVYLSTYSVSGQGDASTSSSWGKDLIKAVVAPAKFGKSVATGLANPSYSSASKMLQSFEKMTLDMDRLRLKSKEYNTGDNVELSINGKFLYGVGYTSPIRLSHNGDKVQFKTYCNSAVSNAKFHVAFSFTTK